MVTWLNETQRDPRLNEILHPLYTMDEDSEMCIFNFLKDIYAKVDIDDTNLMKVKMIYFLFSSDVKFFCLNAFLRTVSHTQFLKSGWKTMLE